MLVTVLCVYYICGQKQFILFSSAIFYIFVEKLKGRDEKSLRLQGQLKRRPIRYFL